MQEPDEANEQYREKLRKDHSTWMDRKHRESLALDKSLLTLSSGGVGLSVVLVTQMFSVEGLSPLAIVVLMLSWLGFVAAIYSSLTSFVSSQKAIDSVIDGLDAQIIGNDPKQYEDLTVLLNKKTSRFNTAARLSFFTAVALTLVFVTVMIVEAKCAEHSRNQERTHVVVHHWPSRRQAL